MARPKPTVDRIATDKELECIEKMEEMLKEEKKLPTTSQMVRNLAVDHWRSLKAFIRGKQVLTSHEEAERRWEICKGCPKLLYDETNPDTGKIDGRCIECGCFMNVKVHYAISECPIGKWEKDCGHGCDCGCEENCEE